MTEFTKEEVSLCKQVACRHRKEIVRGDHYVHIGDKRNEVILSLGRESLTFRNLIPLWTISDCLEFFDEREIEIAINHLGDIERGWRVQLWKKHLQAFYSDYSCEERIENKTPLEACLRAILAVLEENK